ncbi:MAG: class I SAM-dependent methyltransferase family protein [Nitrosopumilus sp.]|nr:class I SAM-dependent methyltransferase family protein [Nitrosopumilus sp.]MDF2426625.1 class I SAM-dependent methyltransferase family protein [Nitrosopumilus sp.]MDF2430282.1 class I SAM-dependent methyltransferase family protein [Nitrosopumilus sp.]
MLKKALENILTENESDELISAFDQIGEIIIVRIPDSLLSKKEIIGKTLLDEVKIVRSVFYQASAVEGEFRTRSLEILAGEDNTETEYREFGCRFTVDVKNAFFSPRLSTERERIANLIQNGEVMTNMFAGIGMFSITAAKKKKCTVYSLDINPVASKLCEINIGLNKLAGNIISINGDASEIIKEQLVNKSDRTLMVLPERSDEFLESAINTTKDGGIIHYYSHIHADKKTDAGKLSEEHYLKVTPVKSEILNSKIVRAVGPRFYQTVVDIKISK